MSSVQTEIVTKLNTYVFQFTQSSYPEFKFIDKRFGIERKDVNTVLISLDFLNHIQQSITVGGMGPIKPSLTEKRAQLLINLYYPKGYDQIKLHDYTQLVQDKFQNYEGAISGAAKFYVDQVSSQEYNPVDDVFLLKFTITFKLFERVN